MARIYSYRKLFSLEVWHRFYRSYRSQDLAAEPTTLCRQQLGRLGMKFRKTATGFEIYADVDANGKLKKKVNVPAKFTFLLTCVHPYFENFTNLPLSMKKGEKYYFSNATVNPVDVFGLGDMVNLLNKGDQISDGDLISYLSTVYGFSMPGTGTESFRMIREEDGISVDEKDIDDVDGTLHYQNRMEGLDTGLYRLEANSIPVDRFYFNPDRKMNRAFGVIEIFTEAPTENRFILSGDQLSPKEYGIAFSNRKTFWRYRVHNRSGISLPSPTVAIGNDTSKFDDAGGLTFISKEAMDLKEEPLKGIRLLKNTNPSSEVVGNLSNGKIDQITPEENNGSYKIYSDIYIYL